MSRITVRAFLMLAILPATIFAQTEGLRPMRGLRQTSYWEQNWPWLTAVIAVGTIALIALVVWLARRKPATKQLTPAEEARLRLGEAADLADGQDDKAFSTTVSDALRVFMERAFSLRAPEQTTEEFLQSAQSSGRLPEASLQTLARFLELCDLAKFAQQSFGDEERLQLLNTARNFVDEAGRPATAEPKETAAT
ncbi:hypothetical protein [Cerasicoccus arenae]|uniref:hypothetical protein n=1 Tax=Cerasicoccus arenae TaxID=424488 RepID=UPI00167A369D|nr:hypothetical protein [Cerasicoccus arenae]MBK1858584.1 hypothetical protein [Cerasicoccus arenae]